MRWYVLILMAVVILSGGGLLMIAFNTDPYAATDFAIGLFFVSFFVFFWSLASVIALVLQVWVATKGHNFRAILFSGDPVLMGASFRRGFYCAVLATLAVALSRQDMVNILTVVLPLVAITIIEIVIHRRDGKKVMYTDFS